MRKLLLLLSLGPAVVPAAGLAAGDPPGSGDFGIYYSYANQKLEGEPSNPGGSGVGAEAQWNLPYNLFVNGLYQYNNEYAEPVGIYAGLRQKTDQVRAGGGIQFPMPNSPLTLYGRVDYVHYGFEYSSGGVIYPRDNNDGMGYSAGFKTLAGPVALYLEGGYIDLSDSHGQEAAGGLSFPLGNGRVYRSPLEFFVEYRWTHLDAVNGGNYSDIYYDYRAGLRMPF
jgi:hypothetical protein